MEESSKKIKIGFFSQYSTNLIENFEILLQKSRPNFNCELHEIKLNSEEDDLETQEKLDSMEVLVTEWNILSFIDSLQNVKWIQLIWVGIEPLIKHQIGKPKLQIQITRYGGPYNSQMSEYVLSNIINFERGTFQLYENNKEKFWATNLPEYRLISDLKFTILGCGSIGHSVGRHLKQLGGTVYGMVKNEKTTKDEYIDKYFAINELSDYLKKSDYLINLLPATQLTHNLLKPLLMESCNNVIFINIGRADIIEEDTLLKCLDEGKFKAAILDVHDPEPLPKESRLWEHPKIILTPHSSGRFFEKDAALVLYEQLQRYVKNEKLAYLVDFEKCY